MGVGLVWPHVEGHVSLGDNGQREDWGRWGSVAQCSKPAPRGSWDTGLLLLVTQGEAAGHKLLLHLQHFSRRPLSKNAKCGTTFVPQQRTEMSIKQNPPSPPGSMALEVAQAGHAKRFSLAASTPSRRKVWMSAAELPAGTRVCYIHLQASFHYRSKIKCKYNRQVMQHHQLFLKMTPGGQSSGGSPDCATCSPLPSAASAAPGLVLIQPDSTKCSL